MKLLFILGPTASGKTELALSMKQPIMNADSLQIYKGLDIGTAKPTQEQRSKVPHYLFDEVSCPQTWTAGDFRTRALELLKTLQKEGVKKLLIVGGSGFYIQALEKGMYPVKKVPASILESLNKKTKEQLYNELKLKDPEYAKTINENDNYRILRALSIIENEKKTITDIKKEFQPQPLPYEYKKICLDISKDDLNKKIETRTESMLEKGWVEETRQILKQLQGRQWSPLESVGYKECVDYIEGRIESKLELKKQIIKRTKLYAKHQRTWLKKNPSS